MYGKFRAVKGSCIIGIKFLIERNFSFQIIKCLSCNFSVAIIPKPHYFYSFYLTVIYKRTQTANLNAILIRNCF
jgi:hypothetical protein